jgi:hypothetical protein
MTRHGSRLRAVTENPASRITVALIDRAAADLQVTHERTGLSKTDIVNRAISLYKYIDAELSTPGTELIIRKDGKDHIIKLL